MKRLAPVVLLLALYHTGTTQQKLEEAVPDSQGFSDARLQKIGQVMTENLDGGKAGGIAWLIARNGKIVSYKATGFDDKDSKTPLKRDAIFRIASQTKAVTSVAVMILYEEGKFLLDDPVSSYIHSFKNPRVIDRYNPVDTTYTTLPAKREVTIRDLLTHTSGIGYAQIGDSVANAIYAKNQITAGIGSRRTSLAEDMQRLGSLPLFNQPGEQYLYGLNTDVLGYLVEVVSGVSLEQFFRTRIFEPLGMNDTYFNLPQEKHNRLVQVYYPDSARKLVKAPARYELNGPIWSDYPKTKQTYFSGGAGLSSTLYDYAVFLQMLLNGGSYNGQKILSRHSVRLMTMNQIGGLRIWGNNEFGLGFSVVTEDGSARTPNSEGTFGWGGAFSTTYWADPKEKIIGLSFRQAWADPYSSLHEKVKVLAYSALND